MYEPNIYQQFITILTELLFKNQKLERLLNITAYDFYCISH